MKRVVMISVPRIAIALVTLAAGTASRAAAQDRPVTFTKDIAPIVFANCSACHRPGGSSSFNLLTYADVRRRAQAIAEATRTRYMPPWKPEPGAGEFIGVRRLSDAQIELIEQWIKQGTVEGDPAALPPVPAWSS